MPALCGGGNGHERNENKILVATRITETKQDRGRPAERVAVRHRRGAQIAKYRGIHETQAGWQLDASKNHCALLHSWDKNLYLSPTLGTRHRPTSNAEGKLYLES